MHDIAQVFPAGGVVLVKLVEEVEIGFDGGGDAGHEKLFLAAEILVNGPFPHPRDFGDLFDLYLRIVTVQEGLHRRLNDPLPL